MQTNEWIIEAYAHIKTVVHRVADGLSAEQISFQPGDSANSIGWLLWHLARVQDDQLTGAIGTDQVWSSGDWAAKFSLPYESLATGFGQSSAEVGQFKATTELLLGYYDAVHEHTEKYLRQLSDGDLNLVVDEAWDPPVTAAVRLASVLSDCLQHAGQAAYVRGLINERN